MTTKQQQFERLIGSLKMIILSDRFLTEHQKITLTEAAEKINTRVQDGNTKGTEMGLCMIRNTMHQWRKEFAYAVEAA